MNFCLISSKLTSGCSYINHITLAASIAEPPPKAMITSGLNFLINSTPSITVSMLGSGSTSKYNSISTLFLLRLIASSILATYPKLYIPWSVTIIAFSMYFISLKYLIEFLSK